MSYLNWLNFIIGTLIIILATHIILSHVEAYFLVLPSEKQFTDAIQTEQIVEKTTTVENLDIIVAAIDNSATLKRFSRMGNNILLLAENPKYDPIMLNEDQVSILGVAVGLVKQNC